MVQKTPTALKSDILVLFACFVLFCFGFLFCFCFDCLFVWLVFFCFDYNEAEVSNVIQQRIL